MIELSAADVRAFLVSHHGLARRVPGGRAAARGVLDRARCIQLDPLEPLGSNADLVAMARIEDLRLGEVYDALLPGHAFEHYAKERCLLPASAFPHYRDTAGQATWFRLSERLRKLDDGLLNDVLAEVRERGPVAPREVEDRGSVDPLDWNGWKGTGRRATMALEVLFARCQIVVCGRLGKQKRYDVPERALPGHAAAPAIGDFSRWALLERVEAAGFLPRNAGPWWGQLGAVRKTLSDALVAEGRVEEVGVEGARGVWLAPAGFLDRPRQEPDGEMRILGPLDPLIWDRALVRAAFDFDYLWEVYKPKAQRRWGWYVVPVLQGDRLVARFEGRFVDGRLTVDNRWIEAGVRLDARAWKRMIARHEALAT